MTNNNQQLINILVVIFVGLVIYLLFFRKTNRREGFVVLNSGVASVHKSTPHPSDPAAEHGDITVFTAEDGSQTGCQTLGNGQTICVNYPPDDGNADGFPDAPSQISVPCSFAPRPDPDDPSQTIPCFCLNKSAAGCIKAGGTVAGSEAACLNACKKKKPDQGDYNQNWSNGNGPGPVIPSGGGPGPVVNPNYGPGPSYSPPPSVGPGPVVNPNSGIIVNTVPV